MRRKLQRVLSSARAAVAPAVMATVAMVAMAPPAAAADPSYNVCEAQLLRDVRERFGSEVQRIEFAWEFQGSSGNAGDPPSGANVFPVNCGGFYFYEIFTSYEVCVVQPHYGSPPDYAVFVSANAGC